MSNENTEDFDDNMSCITEYSASDMFVNATAEQLCDIISDVFDDAAFASATFDIEMETSETVDDAVLDTAIDAAIMEGI